MTYRELGILIDAMTAEQKDLDVTVHDRAGIEFFPVTDVKISREDDHSGDVLDPGHPYLSFD